MQGLMSPYPLTLPHLFHRAERLFGEKTITTLTATGKDRTTYAEWAARTRRLAGALDTLGISADGRVATFAWNSARHLELYFAAPCSGRVLHTLNIRLFPEQLSYIVDHAEDEVDLRRPVAAEGAVAARRRLQDRQAHRRDGRRRGRRPGGRPDPRLRGADRRRRAGRVPRRRREPGRGDVLHERHHRQPEGRRLQPPLERPALDGRDARRHGRGLRARHRHAGGPDVPRQRLGPRPRGGDGRRRARVPRPADLHAAGDRRADRGREGHARGRRPDDLDGRARASSTIATPRRCATSCAAARPSPRRCRSATASSSACRSCTPGG